jgi:hypothetical protein
MIAIALLNQLVSISARASGATEMPEQKLQQVVVRILRKAGFRVMTNVAVPGATLDALAEKTVFGTRRLYAIECKDLSRPLRTQEAHQVVAALSPNVYHDFHEIWLIARDVSPSAREAFDALKYARVFTIDEFRQEMLSPQTRARAASPVRKARRANPSSSERQDVMEAVTRQLEDMGLHVSDRTLQDTDIVAERTSPEKTELIGIDVAFGGDDTSDFLVINAVDAFRPNGLLTEAWIIAPDFSVEAYGRAARSSFLRLYTFQDFGIATNGTRRAGQRGPPKTKAGKAITLNYASLAANILALQTLIDDRLALLAAQRPNSDEAIGDRSKSIKELGALRRSLDDMRVAMHRFRADTRQEADVVKATATFTNAVQAWWTAGHERILSSGYAMGLFVSAVSICSLAGTRGAAVTIVAGALAGGKPLMDSLKGIGKKLFSG